MINWNFLASLKFVCFTQNFAIRKFQDADIKFGNSVFQIPVEKFPNKAFLVTILMIFFVLDESSHFEKFYYFKKNKNISKNFKIVVVIIKNMYQLILDICVVL